MGVVQVRERNAFICPKDFAAIGENHMMLIRETEGFSKTRQLWKEIIILCAKLLVTQEA